MAGPQQPPDRQHRQHHRQRHQHTQAVRQVARQHDLPPGVLGQPPHLWLERAQPQHAHRQRDQRNQNARIQRAGEQPGMPVECVAERRHQQRREHQDGGYPELVALRRRVACRRQQQRDRRAPGQRHALRQPDRQHHQRRADQRWDELSGTRRDIGEIGVDPREIRPVIEHAQGQQQRAPHIATAPVAAPTAKSGSLMRPTEAAARASDPVFRKAPPRTRTSLPANIVPARNSGMT